MGATGPRESNQGEILLSKQNKAAITINSHIIRKAKTIQKMYRELSAKLDIS